MNKILRGTVYLAASALFIKVVGAVYRLYLTSLIGADGVGIYQMVFPFYAMLLTLSSSGIPAGLATLIAGGVDPEKVVYKSIIVSYDDSLPRRRAQEIHSILGIELKL